MTNMLETRATRAMNMSIELDSIAALSDPTGVLSVYADADPALAAGARPTWQSPVRAGLRRLVNDARRTRSRAEWIALRARLDAIEPELEALLDARVGPRGRALFAPVSGGEIHRVELPVSLAPLVTLDRYARVLPLLAAAQDGRPAGVATLSWDRLESAEWRFDLLNPLKTIEFPAAQPRGSRPATNPAVPQPFPERDRFESAAGARMLTLLRNAGDRLGREAEARGWDVLVVDGDPRLLDVLSDGLRTNSYQLVRSPHSIGGVQNAVAAARVGSTVRTLRTARTAELLRKVGESSASTRDPLVLDRAFDEGRIEHLLIAMPSESSGPAASESLLRRALATGADVTIVPPEAADLEPGGAAALLRW